MTETSPVASTSQLLGELGDADERDAVRLHRDAGHCRCRSSSCAHRDVDGNILPWDGESMGELEIRGPWVAAGYYDTPEQAERWTDDGWFKTGDVVSIHPRGFIQIKDRSKDVIKSGGEWISSVELENALMAHPAVAEAAVIAVPDAKWDERPLAAVVLREGADGDRRRAARVPRAELREVVAARPLRVRRRDPEDERRQVQEDGAARDVRRSVRCVVIETVWLDNPPVNAVNAGSSRRCGTRSRTSATTSARSSCAAAASVRSRPAQTSAGSSAAMREGRPPRRHPAGRRPDRGGARPGRRGDPRLLPRRRARDRARVRLPDRDARRAARLPGGQPRPAARAAAARSARRA